MQTTVLVVLLVLTTPMQPVAFALQAPQVAAASKNEPLATPPKQRPTTTPLVDPPPAQQTKGKSHKWIVIVAAAAGVGIAATLALRGKDGSGNDEPVSVVVGTPSVGQPQ